MSVSDPASASAGLVIDSAPVNAPNSCHKTTGFCSVRRSTASKKSELQNR